MIKASRELLAPRTEVWALVSEPYNLPDWWPGYSGVRPDRRGLVTGARWQVTRSRTPGFLRRPGGEGMIVITSVAEGTHLRWHDVQQRVDAGVEIANADADRTRATAFVDGSFWRLLAEGVRDLPRQSVDRLHDLCQTAASL